MPQTQSSRLRLARTLAQRRLRGVRRAYSGRASLQPRFDASQPSLVGVTARPHRFWTAAAVPRDDLQDDALEVTLKLPQHRRDAPPLNDPAGPRTLAARSARTGALVQVTLLDVRLPRRGAAGGARALVLIEDARGRPLSADDARRL